MAATDELDHGLLRPQPETGTADVRGVVRGPVLRIGASSSVPTASELP